MDASDSTMESPIPKKRARMYRKLGVPLLNFSGVRGPTTNCFGGRQSSHNVIAALTTDTAVNIEIAIPIAMVTAKPRTGPEPNQNNSAVAIKAVAFESTIVA